MADDIRDAGSYPRSIGFAKPPSIKSLSILPEHPFYVHDLPPGYMSIDEALKAYHYHCLAYEINKHGRSILVSMAEMGSTIMNGVIPSFHVGPLMKVRELSRLDWNGDGLIPTQMYKEEFKYITYDDDLQRRYVTDKNIWYPTIGIINEDDELIFGRVVLLIDDVLRIINMKNTATNSEDPPSEDEVYIPRGGRPPLHDSEGFLLNAFKILWLNGAPSTQAELINQTAQAYNGAQKASNGASTPPGETWMKEKIRPLWRIIEEGRKGR